MKCSNIYYQNKLTDFDVMRYSPTRQNKYIFCKDCRTRWCRGGILYWRCNNCSNILTSTNNPLNKKYCDLNCRYESHRKIMFKKEKMCVLCGQIFLTSWGKYCSQKCSNRYQLMKRRKVELCLTLNS